jgi:hypothetical protein
MSEGFLGRWSRRKLDVKQGKPVQEPSAREALVVPKSETYPESAQPAAQQPSEAAQAPLPTLEDVKALTSHSDFSRFAGAHVPPEVKNAAMKKLFADPRFNVMDGLDIYTGDYTQPDPMPLSMLRQLASAKFLGLFREETQAAEQTRDVADDGAEQIVAKSSPMSEATSAPASAQPEDADPDLRLQQDHAAAGKNPGRGAQ